MSDSGKLHIGRYAFLLDIANVIVLLILFFVAVYYYGQLPEEVPIRFDAKGTPIAHRSKATLFVFPLLALVISVILFLIRRQPGMMNYPVEVTDENEAALYRESSTLVSGIMLVTNVLILYSCWNIVQIALGHSTGLSPSFLWIPILLIALLAYNAFRRMKKLG
ncbi:MAG: DUF1648 domain-containing protein [Bacteroidetes bacterium]|jgi:uncharacterized membrane protein|nr:DUF1648 domain-containing protein [Bacteroidota bacterium]